MKEKSNAKAAKVKPRAQHDPKAHGGHRDSGTARDLTLDLKSNRSASFGRKR